MLFLRDGTMLVTSGDGFNYRDQAQTLDNHVGKIIRLNDDGTVPDDNPFLGVDDALPEIWSFGHRNPTGLTLSEDGKTIFEHEHGPKGGDELNIVTAGKNYGWPLITYGSDYSGALISPFTEGEGLEQGSEEGRNGGAEGGRKGEWQGGRARLTMGAAPMITVL